MIGMPGQRPKDDLRIEHGPISDVAQLELVSRRVVDGLFAGKHRSTHRGGHCEFAHHRPYTPGDEVRLIDWRVYAKSDRYYVKQYEEETNLRAMLVLDASGSMGFGMSTVSKFAHARVASACLARLLLRQRDAVGLSAVSAIQRRVVPPRTQARHLRPMFEVLEQAQPAGEIGLAAELELAAQRLKRRGLLIVLSDFFDGIESLSVSLKRMRARGHEVILLHVLAPEEINFDFQRPARFESLEQKSKWLSVDPAALRRKYLERFEEFLAQLKRLTNEVGCDYVRVLTHEDLAGTLTRYLRSRMAKSR